jgi:hypothetical protein
MTPIPFQEECCSYSKQEKFGLCDDPSVKQPAYIDEDKQEKWIAIINNPNKKNIRFSAIDNCISLYKKDGTLDKRCDGVLQYKKHLIFIELKDRGMGPWVKKGSQQLQASIQHFKKIPNSSSFSMEAYICNKQKPQAHKGQMVHLQKFKDSTGVTLRISQTINIRSSDS